MKPRVRPFFFGSGSGVRASGSSSVTRWMFCLGSLIVVLSGSRAEAASGSGVGRSGGGGRDELPDASGRALDVEPGLRLGGKRGDADVGRGGHGVLGVVDLERVGDAAREAVLGVLELLGGEDAVLLGELDAALGDVVG